MTDLVYIRLSDEALDAIADRVAQRLAPLIGPSPDRWMTASEAAAHLSISTNALHKLTSAREIPFSQKGAGAKLWFKRGELDRWRESGQ